MGQQRGRKGDDNEGGKYMNVSCRSGVADVTVTVVATTGHSTGDHTASQVSIKICTLY